MERKSEVLINLYKLLSNLGQKLELEEFMSGYTLKNYLGDNMGMLQILMENEENNPLTIQLERRNVSLSKSSENIAENLTAYKYLFSYHRTLEKTTDGVIYTISERKYSKDGELDNIEKQIYFFSNEKIQELLNIYQVEDINDVISLLAFLKRIEVNRNIKEDADDYKEEFFNARTNCYSNDSTTKKTRGKRKLFRRNT